MDLIERLQVMGALEIERDIRPDADHNGDDRVVR